MANKANAQQKRLARKSQKDKIRKTRQKKRSLSPIAPSRPPLDEIIANAIFALDAGEIGLAEKTFNKLYKKHPNNDYVHYGMGLIAGIHGELEQARLHLTRAVELAPNFVEALYNLAITLQKLMQLGDTILCYRRVLQIAPDDDPVRADAQEQLDSMEKAILENENVSIETFIQSDQIFHRGVSLMNAQEWQDAISHFKEVVELNPSAPQSFGNLGICHASMGEKQLALDAFDAALAYWITRSMKAMNPSIFH